MGEREQNVFFLVALVGPLTLGASYIFCRFVNPGLCTDPPNILIGCCLIFTHILSGIGTLAYLLMGRSAFRRLECYTLLGYWGSLAGLFGMDFFLKNGPWEVFVWSILFFAAATPVLAALRMLCRLFRR